MFTQIRLKNGHIHRIQSVSYKSKNDTAILAIQSEESFDTLYSDFEDDTNISVIELLDDSGDTVEAPWKNKTLVNIKLSKNSLVDEKVNPNTGEIESVYGKLYEVSLNNKPVTYVTQDELDIVNDAIAELAEIIGG